MYNILILDLDKDIKNCISSLFDKKNFKLVYANENCAFLKLHNSSYINIWITSDVYDKHNLMTYNKLDKCYIYVPYKETNTIIQDLHNAYIQLSKETKHIIMVTKVQRDVENIALKKKLLIWCIENVHGKIPFVELKHNESMKDCLMH